MCTVSPLGQPRTQPATGRDREGPAPPSREGKRLQTHSCTALLRQKAGGRQPKGAAPRWTRVRALPLTANIINFTAESVFLIAPQHLMAAGPDHSALRSPCMSLSLFSSARGGCCPVRILPRSQRGELVVEGGGLGTLRTLTSQTRARSPC